VPKTIRRKHLEDEIVPLTRTIIEIIGDRLKNELYCLNLGLTQAQLQIIKEEVAGWDEPDLEEHGPVTKWLIKHISDELKRANKRYYIS